MSIVVNQDTPQTSSQWAPLLILLIHRLDITLRCHEDRLFNQIFIKWIIPVSYPELANCAADEAEVPPSAALPPPPPPATDFTSVFSPSNRTTKSFFVTWANFPYDSHLAAQRFDRNSYCQLYRVTQVVEYLGWDDLALGSSHAWWATTAATY